jgi:hypothetical protein
MAGYKVFASGDVLTAADFMDYIMKQTVMSFSTTGTRDSSLPSGTVRKGMVAAIAPGSGDAYIQVNTDGSTTGWENLATEAYVDIELSSAQRPLVSLWMNEGL